jgi:indolepyruvate ferredoxin oxidoreductase alpha subunit
LVRARIEKKPPFKMHIDPEKCIGEDCGCARLCTRMFHCPGLMWDGKAGKAAIDEVMCAGCGVCADICPKGAIIKEAIEK